MLNSPKQSNQLHFGDTSETSEQTSLFAGANPKKLWPVYARGIFIAAI